MADERRTLICPYTDNCIVYKNWAEKYLQDKRANIISLDGSRYACLALSALEDLTPEGGVSLNRETSERLRENSVAENERIRTIGCSHITLLNMLRQMTERRE